jgi:predicted amidophosphoribosyltransferase
MGYSATESRNGVNDAASKAAFDPRAFGDIYCPSESERERKRGGSCADDIARALHENGLEICQPVHLRMNALVATVPSKSAPVRVPIRVLAGHFRAPFQELQSGSRAIIACDDITTTEYRLIRMTGCASETLQPR